MKIRHLIFSLLPALAVADNATTVPDDEPWHPPLPEELLHPQTGNAALPATAQPVVSYRAPAHEEQTWLKLLYVRDTEEWPGIFRRMADATRENNMQMCHGFALWLKGQELVHLRYDDDLSLSGIYADGHTYGVLFVEFNPYGIRVCPLEGYDLTGKNGGVCWQNSPTRLWCWAEAGAFWAELPKLLKTEARASVSSAQDSAVKREVATKGQRMVIFWAPGGYAAKAWWPSFVRLHSAVGPHRFSLVAADGLKLWTDVTVPNVRPARGSAPAAATPAAPAAGAGTAPPTAPTPITAAPPQQAASGVAPTSPATPATPAPQAAPSTPAAAPQPAPASPPATGTAQPPAQATAPTTTATPIPENLQPASGSERDVAPAASVRPWALEGGVAPVPGRRTSTQTSTPAATPATTPSAPPAPAPAAQAATPPSATTPATAPATTPAEPAPAPSGRTLDSLPTLPH